MTAKAERKLESSECVKLGLKSVQSQIKFFLYCGHWKVDLLCVDHALDRTPAKDNLIADEVII